MPLRYGMNPHQTPAQLYTLKPKLPITGKDSVFWHDLLCLGVCVYFCLSVCVISEVVPV